MSKPYLEITYRRGKPFAAYLYLARQPGDKATRSVAQGLLVVDYASDGRAIGIEITGLSPRVSADLRELLSTLRIDNLAAELAPLEAA